MLTPNHHGMLNIKDIESYIEAMMITDTNTSKFTSCIKYGPNDQWGRKLLLFINNDNDSKDNNHKDKDANTYANVNSDAED